MYAKIYDWFDLALTYAAGKLLPMVALTALGVLAIQAALKIT